MPTLRTADITCDCPNLCPLHGDTTGRFTPPVQADVAAALIRLAETAAPARPLSREDELRIHAARLAVEAANHQTGFRRAVDGTDLTTQQLVADAREWFAFMAVAPADEASA